MNTKPTTYTIATTECGMLVACVPDGQEIKIEFPGISLDECTIAKGVTLTDDPLEGDKVMYSGFALGYLSDVDVVAYKYAVLRS